MRPFRCPTCHRDRVVVVHLKCNYSAFNGYRYTPSEYSQVLCLDCRHTWRTKSDKVYELPKQGLGKEVPPPDLQ